MAARPKSNGSCSRSGRTRIINDYGDISGDVIDKKTNLELTIIARPVSASGG
jgi:hypothetical protein